jgi:branched-chain amino acid transport system ATP-binding protein
MDAAVPRPRGGRDDEMAELLEIQNLRVCYGNVEVLHGIDLSVKEGEIVSLLGANGAGKSTTLLAVSGLVRSSEGTISLDREVIGRLPAHEVVKRGITQAPEGRRIFGTLTVEENLTLGGFVRTDAEGIEETRAWVYQLFPVLGQRRDQLGGTLSGGEQQMLTIGRALMARPRILLLDEPSLGLAPLLVQTIFQTIREINRAGLTVLLVEQNARAALKLAHRGYVMELGRIVLMDSAPNLLANPDVQKAYLGGGHA